MSGEQRLRVLREEWHGCTRCRLSDLRDGPDIVFGHGPVPADIMLLGSRPTETDEKKHRPFTSDEGELLVELLKTADIDPDLCYRTHVVACRPKIYLPATEEEEERVETVEPQKGDYLGVYDKKAKMWLREGCKNRLHAQIYEVDPRIIITFGESPLKLLEARDNNGKKPRKMSEAQVDLFEIEIPGKVAPTIRYPIMAALDMGYLIKNPVTADHGPIAIVLEALRRANAYVQWVKRQEGII